MPAPKLRIKHIVNLKFMWTKAIKYLINFAGICLMNFYARIAYGIIARLPECKNVMEIIWNNVFELSQIYLIYLVLITVINFLVERKLEKRKNSKEFLVLAFINIISLISIISLFSNEFYM